MFIGKHTHIGNDKEIEREINNSFQFIFDTNHNIP
jgi:hypothetical protein